MKNYYEILEVNENASEETIQRVYKLLAKKYHPDLQEADKAEECEEKFKEISEAYEILSNEGKRKLYDEQLQEFKNSQNSDAVTSAEMENLKDYCSKLENELHTVKHATSLESEQVKPSSSEPNKASYTNQSRQATNHIDKNVEQAQTKAYQAAVEKAYHDAYINTLKRFGYKIRYKKTFKQRFKNFVVFLLTCIIVSILAFIVWHIPPLKAKIISVFPFNF